MLQSSSSCSGREQGVQGHVKYEILSIKLRYTTHCCGWVTVVLSCKSQTLEIKDRPVDLFHAGNRWPSMCCSVCASLSPVEPLSPGSQHCSLGCTAYNYPQSTLKQLSFTVINSLHFKGFMWHQTPRATVCYYKLLLLPLSYLYILKLMMVLTKDTIRILSAIVIILAIKG